ncbi:GH92 family glycosyl hydrolase [Flavivirga aquimarina]|uniref:GH92 family glycosyl hydrolase n=1 Tax=Flavivirga aquimarina TaxID=2027862 RepID=A0ABT8WC61_9FLAO|nr:GH92 family glycosyl hydrolase [Flavivirga aquimarina]MDO5970731.1 GH92 family glycosyl hydrolase [Flavivirga aquimarina]
MKSSQILKSGIFIISFTLILLVSCKKEQEIILPTVKDQLVDKVYPLLDTENSRWFFFSSASRPFGMVNLSPDTEIDGAWGSGYRYKTDTIKGFSHIHAWQMSGISIMPVTISETNKKSIYKDFYSKFSHKTEKITPGYHYVELDRYQITSELTSTKRVGFHQYAFPKNEQASILFNLNTMLGPCKNSDGTLEKNSDKELSGKVVMEPTHRRPKPLTVFFKIKLNTAITAIQQDENTGNYLVTLNEPKEKVLVKVGISYTSVENANNNINVELPHWNFDDAVSQSKTEWNDLLGRIEVEGGTKTDQRRFYTDLWHALQGRRIISDTNGAYPDNTGDQFRIGQLPLNENGKPKFNHYNSDSFWGAQWTINTLWGLVYPEIMEEFVHSLMQYYKDGGIIPRGPSGGNYTYVMTGASSTPFIVSAIQKGIIKDDLEGIYQALKKNHMPNGIMAKAGYEHTTDLGGGLKYYIKNGFVPYPIPEGNFGGHQDGASLTMEYAYQDWTLAQLAKKLELEDDYNYFLNRSKNYKNVFDTSVNWMRPKNVDGIWNTHFDPYQVEHGFIESNGAQSTWFVPHDLNGLATLIGGNEKAIEKLNAQFKTAEKLNFTAGTSHAVEGHPEYSRIPVNFGNQPSIQTSFIFNKLGRPDLTQYWSRNVVKKTFSGLSPATGYSGDEDQGLMGSLNVLMKIGLFQMNGGTEANTEYQIGSPIFDKIMIKLNKNYYPGDVFEIQTINNSPENVYVNSIMFNNTDLKNYAINHNDLIGGGRLQLNMNANKYSNHLITSKK